MAKFFGKIGYGITEESDPGVWVERIVERYYSGDIIRNTRRLQSSDKVNDNITISNELSIIADPYAYQNFYTIKYAEFMGCKWKINNIEVKYPRLILSLGGVYNGE